MLHTAPSFSIYSTTDEAEEEKKIQELVECHAGSGEFSFEKSGMDLIEENGEEEEKEGLNEILGIEDQVEPLSPPMYLATGLGIGGGGFGSGIGGGGEFVPANFNDGGNVEDYYKRMVDEDPCNPLFLGNYAKLLESKGDLQGAEEFYFRASFVDPQDGEILMLYAKLVWQLHHDRDRAQDYFERAVLAAPEDSHVLAAYARFLWEIEDKKEDFSENDQNQVEEDKTFVSIQNSAFEEGKESIGALPCLAPLRITARVGSEVASSGDGIVEGGNIEAYYKRMIEENPSNPMFLKNYAQFLYQSKGDLEAAEEYYSRTILADPKDGEIISEYAKLIWELHHDQHRALGYFERAVEASPQDSHVLAAYARFLWEIEDDEEEDETQQEHIQSPLVMGAMTSAST